MQNKQKIFFLMPVIILLGIFVIFRGNILADNSNDQARLAIYDHDGSVAISPFAVSSGNISDVSAVSLSNRNFLIAYQDNANSKFGTLAIYNVLSDQVGTPVVFNQGATKEITTLKMDNKNILIAYRDDGNSGYGTFVAYNEMGQQVMSPTVFNKAATDNISLAVMDNNNVLIVYSDGGNANYGTFVIYNNVGQIVNSPTVFNKAATANIALAIMENHNVIFAYSDGGNSNYGTFAIYDNQGVIVKTPTIFSSSKTDSLSLSALNNHNFIIAYGNSSNGAFLIYDYDGNTVKSTTNFSQTTANNISTVLMDNHNIYLAYSDGGNSNYGTFTIYDRDGNLVKVASVITANPVSQLKLINLSNNNILTSFIYSETKTCTETDWTSQISPNVCPSTGTQIKTWQKNSNCQGGAAHSNENINCVYIPSIVACQDSDWQYSLDTSVCPSSGQQTKTWSLKTGDCQGGVTHRNEQINCVYISGTSVKSVNFKITNAALFNSLKGKIILNVQLNGEAYYIDPADKIAYYLGRPADAFAIMRSKGIGITDENLEKIPVKYDKNINYDLKFINAQKGKIFLQIQSLGQAWYVNPADGSRYFMSRPTAAFDLMKKLGIGVSNNNFSKLIK
jgi:hypothetical protein